MLNLKAKLAEDITEGLKSAGLPMPKGDVLVTGAEKAEHGDYASPVALQLAKLVQGKQPMEIVELIAEHMPKHEYIGALEAAAPGFLNIRISTEWLIARLDDVIEQDICGDTNVGEGKLVNLEFISANPTGPLTLGNARTAFSADTLANVLECAGFNVTREYYVNDAGEQIRKLGESVLRRALQDKDEQVEFPEELYQGEYVKILAQTLAEQWKENENREFTAADLEDTNLIDNISREAMELMLAEIKKTVHDDLKIHFDVWTSERALRKSGKVKAIIEALEAKDYVYEKDGALYLRTTKFGDDEDRVLVKKTGQYAYIAPDIAYHQDKFDREFDLIFTFLGADHQGHVPKLTWALEALGNDTNKVRFPVAQWLALTKDGKEFKPSKRRGEIYGAKDLIEEVGYDAARFFMVQHSLASHMTLDLDLAKERSERNPVYYVQYAYVRLQSILRKAKEQEVITKVGSDVPRPNQLLLNEASELNLIRVMYRLPEVVVDTTESFDVHDLAYYAQDIAKAVHQFYRDVPVLSSQDRDLVLSRLQLVSAARKVLEQTLDLLGISKPDVM